MTEPKLYPVIMPARVQNKMNWAIAESPEQARQHITSCYVGTEALIIGEPIEREALQLQSGQDVFWCLPYRATGEWRELIRSVDYGVDE